MDSMKISTYNCKHFKGDIKKNMCRDLLNQSDFLLLQEHWLYEANFNKFDEIYSDIDLIFEGKSAMDPNILRVGRPFGGCAIIWKSNIKYNICPIKTVSNRLNCINVRIDESTNFLLFNVYMPTDNRSINHSGNIDNDLCNNAHEYQDILAEISIISRNTDTSFIIIGGDFNTDMSRNNFQTEQLKQFCESESFVISDMLPISNIEYTFECKVTGNRSFIDHFLVTENVQSFVKSCFTVDNIDNASDHLALISEFNINCTYFKTNQLNNQTGIAWYKVKLDDITNYKKQLDKELDHIMLPTDALHCKDFRCKLHVDETESFYKNIINSCIIAGKKSLPLLGKGNSNINHNVKAGWNDYCKDKKELALFWHNNWKNEGRPHNSYTAVMRRISRLQYHYAVRCIDKNKNIIKSNKMVSQFISDPRNAWNNCHKLRGNSKKVPSMVDDVIGDKNISGVFSNKYSTLLNSVGVDSEKIEHLKANIESDLIRCNPEFIVCIDDISDALKSLKSGKSDGDLGIYSDHLLYGTEKLFYYLTMLFNCMLTHGYTPSGMRVSTIIPVVKNKRSSISDSDNFRGISLQSSVCKLLDLIIFNKEESKLQTSQLQFGFKPGVSTYMAASVVQETVDYYTNRGGTVYGLALDASKAFDRVEFIKLFECLLKRNVNL